MSCLTSKSDSFLLGRHNLGAGLPEGYYADEDSHGVPPATALVGHVKDDTACNASPATARLVPAGTGVPDPVQRG